MSDDFERDRLAQELRASLARHATDAPAGTSADMLAERIISAADQNAAGAGETQRRGWRGWALPAIAAAAVAGVVGAVVAIENYHPTSTPPVGTSNVSTVQTTPPVTPAPTTPAPTTAPNAADLANVKIRDLTFADGQGWALGTADCLSGPGTCTALLHTLDGSTWTSMGGEAFDVPGVTKGCPETSSTCVTSIRFASADVGYAFGPSAFFMTTDGGAHWQHLKGGAIQLETLHNNVIRVTTTGSGCPSWCNVGVQTSDIGSTTWTPAQLPTTPGGFDVQLARDNAGNAYLLSFGHTSGGTQNATSTLFRSTDDGRSWTQGDEPCPQQSGQEVDSHAIAAGGDGRVSVLCATRQAPQHWFVATSEDGGVHFSAQAGTIPAAKASLLTGDPATVLVAAGDGMVRSTDGGATWQPVADVTGSVSFVGFESPTDGRAVTGGNVIWTTTDGGKRWTSAPFG